MLEYAQEHPELLAIVVAAVSAGFAYWKRGQTGWKQRLIAEIIEAVVVKVYRNYVKPAKRRNEGALPENEKRTAMNMAIDGVKLKAKEYGLDKEIEVADRELLQGQIESAVRRAKTGRTSRQTKGKPF